MTPEQLTGLSDSHLDPQHRLHPDASVAFISMAQQAKQDGLTLDIASGYRDFNRQLQIWNGKFSGRRPLLDSNGALLDTKTLSDQQRLHAILRWSALPGASRHHWGTDIDIYSSALLPAKTRLQLEPWEYSCDGHQYPIYQWLQQHAAQFGFFFPYREDKGGVAVEPWHLSFRPISEVCLTQLTPTLLKQILSNTDIEGKATIFSHLEAIYQRYICNISTN
ncbi:M15 family metallopeptidase [Thaumasiovibrio sp. DFM-14]|uniref:M15 family metallopeptidase n=1 Tax=Thaumasiovibrio sp. DFM-14 TaxID=3384792 RepID=UPI0039A39696